MSFPSSLLAFCLIFFSVFHISAFSVSTVQPHPPPFHPSIAYFYIFSTSFFLFFCFLLSKGQIDNWNVTGPNVEEDAKAGGK